VSKVTAPSRSAAEHHEAGIALASKRRFAEAVKEYLEAARLNPKFSETFYNLGVAYGELGQWNAAIKAYNRAIHLDPKDWQAYCNLGLDCVKSRQYAKAIDAFRRAAELNPQDMTLFVSIGFNCGKLKRYTEAIEAYSRALQLKPDFAIGWYNIGLFHFHQHHYRDAIMAAERALAIEPDYAEPYVIIGMTRRESGDLDRARRVQASSFKMWNLYGIEPEVFDYKANRVVARTYHLRPEIVESTYYLYHYTRDPEYRRMGEKLFNDFVQYCRTDSGYAALSDMVTKTKRDEMESFVFAETFKYFYLLFAPNETLEFDRIVFNTEAHPLRRTW